MDVYMALESGGDDSTVAQAQKVGYLFHLAIHHSLPTSLMDYIVDLTCS